MILLDLTQAIIASLMVQLASDPKTEIQEDLIRHIALNSMRSYSKQFKTKYGELVVCCDNKKYWRREVFPYYKAHRKKDRDASDYDWGLIFDTLSKIKEELKENVPYKVIEVEGAEADDIIATLARGSCNPVLIVSSDKDFVQLQQNPNVTQYSPILKRFISTDDPHRFVLEHIIKGDRGDGIPNFLSPDDVFVSGGRQKSISTKKLEEWVGMTPEEICTTQEMKRGFMRNQTLIDFQQIPTLLAGKINQEFDTRKKNTKSKFLNYLIEHKMRLLIESLEDF